MRLFLHSKNGDPHLSEVYRRAFSEAKELFVVSAYLTEWDSTLKLHKDCKHFRLIIGKDFGITRKKACLEVMEWLPGWRAAQFKVADNISGFHPKAIFWRESATAHYALVGSSNLTRAAFQSNYEANAFVEISASEYKAAKRWIKEIEQDAVPVSSDWLAKYVEGEPAKITKRRSTEQVAEGPTVTLPLPRPVGIDSLLKARRQQLRHHAKYSAGLVNLFRECNNEKIAPPQFYERLPLFWSEQLGNRLQAFGWEIRGKHSKFQELASSFVRIVDASSDDRDDIVQGEIDNLASRKNPTRAALLSEMLCLTFPESYPILNAPVRRYLSSISFKGPRGASEGAKYIDLATKLRSSLQQNEGYPAKNLAELDAIIWNEFS